MSSLLGVRSMPILNKEPSGQYIKSGQNLYPVYLSKINMIYRHII